MKSSGLLILLLAVAIGCDQAPGPFPPNRVYSTSLAKMRRVEVSDQAATDAAKVAEDWFGTPADPRWPSDAFHSESAKTLVSIENLERAAGKINSDHENVHRGLYREHCVTCHGVDGGGNGPAALFQNPYPRNLKHGVFKWKSTERSEKPTRDDLHLLLIHGAQGSAMPSFANVPQDDRETLVDYVIYLAIRGEVERGLIAAAIDDLGYDETTSGELAVNNDSNEGPLENATGIDADLRLSADLGSEGGEVAREILDEVVDSWINVQSKVVKVPESIVAIDNESNVDVESIDRGKAIFHGQIANCAGCHGTGGNGMAVTIDYDDWTKEYSTRIGISPRDRDAFRPLKRLGALPPRVAEPRNLTHGVFRGGGDAATLYRRVSQGIAGAPMPAVAMVEKENGRGLTEDQVGDLIRYVQSLGERNDEARPDPIDTRPPTAQRETSLSFADQQDRS